MALVNFTEAAAVCGFKSRSALYRLRDSDQLAQYLRPAPGPGGRQLLELEPPGLPPLREHVARCVRPQVNNETRIKRARTDHRWETVAADLSEALEAAGGLQLSALEAATIAAALPGAVGAAFGWPGLERLRLALSDAGAWWVGPGEPPRPEGVGEFWAEFGRFEPGEPLPDWDEFWQHTAQIVQGMTGTACSATEAADWHYHLFDALVAVLAGARWDAARWDAGTARLELEDLADGLRTDDPGAADTAAAQLAQLLEAGRLPAGLAAAVRQALERFEAHRRDNPAPMTPAA